ncbi:MAG TPA: hypothetical protein VL625_01285 [Patescibacteria group bacterium]|jgi:hypothetical protein|nr:hypothetical protein [Patescibacteria group bacterium]
MSHWIRTARLSRSYLSSLKVGCLAAIVGIIVMFAQCAAAQGLDPSHIKKMPRFTTMTEEQFENQSDLHEVSPVADKFLAYQIRLPKGWQKASSDKTIDLKKGDEAHVSHRVLGLIAKYYAPQTMEISSEVVIQALELDYSISARNWFLNYVLANGFTLLGMDQLSDTRIEGLYVLVKKDQSFIVRTVAEINGPRMVLTSYQMPEEKWDEEKANQEKVITSFHFLNPEKPRMEPAHTYVYLDLLRFDYPQSWQLTAPSVRAVEGMDVRLVDVTAKDNTLNGQIDIHIESTDADKTLAQMVKDVRGDVKKLGLEIGDLIETPTDYKFHHQVYFNKVEVYDVHGRDNEYGGYELYLAVMIEDRYYYIVSMITPGRNTEFVRWARNIEAYREVIESFRL